MSGIGKGRGRGRGWANNVACLPVLTKAPRPQLRCRVQAKQRDVAGRETEGADFSLKSPNSTVPQVSGACNLLQ